ncbi:alpha-hydroxy-acid oxidizing protein [Alteribacter natronophilus]|uniref:alpha-hydroxy-acid oxidizing protein n=1 Tax=Alteribacter natronophilus TaxID=2583810 RepID=UPI00110D316F|nr:alpha-hydroxy-acid oxidizing protein [Alteribacter natronophilus]TMW71266.1 alpha-hydroxy-acid oxidizing protein [Alteribacter natronophilus]
MTAETDFSILTKAETLEYEAGRRIPTGPYEYVRSGSGSEGTARQNRAAFNQWDLVPRMLRDVSSRSLRTQVWDIPLRTPLALAPVGFQTILHHDGEVGAARAAAAHGIPFTASTVSSYTMEEIRAAAGNVPAFFQLYWPSDDQVAESFVRRAEKCGYDAIVVTVDTPILGYREQDLQNRYFPMKEGAGMANFRADPVFRERCSLTPESGDSEWAAAIEPLLLNESLTWEHIALLKEWTTLPVVIKGILHPEDAREAVERGVDGIVVSNHGGRQLDGTISSIEALPDVAEAVEGKIPVLFDGGVRRGSDVLKALALGADVVSIGRLYAYALTFGEEGVREVLGNLVRDLDISLALTGATSVGELDRSILKKRTSL